MIRKLLVIFAVLVVSFVVAQTPDKIVSFSEAQIFITTVPPDSYHVTHHTFYCGTASGEYTITGIALMPTLSLQLNELLPAPGIYYCSATASNVAGESDWSPEVFFAAIQDPPAAPTVDVGVPTR